MFEKTQNLFVFLALIFGLSFWLLLPPFQAPDEMTHFLRAYQVADGGWVSVKKGNLSGGELPKGLWRPYRIFYPIQGNPAEKVRLSLKGYLKLLSEPLDRTQREFFHFPNTTSYSALVYLPQAFGIFLGNTLGASTLTLVYLGRLGNLLAWIALIYWAIRRASFFRFVILVLSLMPVCLQQAASLSADTLVNGVCTLFVALCLRHALTAEPPLKTRDLTVLAILALLVAVLKQAYLPLVLLIWLIPATKFSSRRFRWTYLLLLSLGCLLLFGGWAWIVSQIVVPMREVSDPFGQWSGVWHHPLEFLSVLGRTYWRNGALFVVQFFGHLGWLDVILPRTLVFLLGASLLGTALCDHEPKLAVSWGFKAIGLGIALLCVILLSLAIWVTWTAVGSDIIEGLQGRYYVPIALLLLLVFYNRTRWLNLGPRRLSIVTLTTSSFSLCWTLAVVFLRYYG